MKTKRSTRQALMDSDRTMSTSSRYMYDLHRAHTPCGTDLPVDDPIVLSDDLVALPVTESWEAISLQFPDGKRVEMDTGDDDLVIITSPETSHHVQGRTDLIKTKHGQILVVDGSIDLDGHVYCFKGPHVLTLATAA